MSDETVGPEEPSIEPERSDPVRSPAPMTGEQSVDAAVARIGAIDNLPVTEHVAVFDEAHRMLQDSLADLDGG